MTILTVWQFDTAEGAEVAARVLTVLATEQSLDVHDAATVSWATHEPRPATRLVDGLAGPRALGEDFWGMLFGLTFFMPLLGAAIGAASGARSGSLADVGIDDAFVNRVRDRVTPGTSALFLLVPDQVVDTVRDALSGDGPAELHHTTLDHAQELALREVFSA